MGGDEFTLLLLHVETEAVVAFFPAHATDPAALLKHADDAMYQAKESGKKKWVLYQPGLRESGASLQPTIG